MKLEVFKELLKKLKEQDEKIDAAYKLEIDLINFSDGYTTIIAILLNMYYGKEGKEWIDWYLYDRNPKDKKSATDKNGKPICYDEESLWKEVEQCRKDNKEEYSLPIPMTTEQRQKIIEGLFKNNI